MLLCFVFDLNYVDINTTSNLKTCHQENNMHSSTVEYVLSDLNTNLIIHFYNITNIN